MRMDFCRFCEKESGTHALYQRYAAYGTLEIRDAVYKAARMPEAKRNEAMRSLLVDKVEVRINTREAIVADTLAERELARRRLVYFVKRFKPGYLAGWVHQFLCRELEKFMAAVERGESPRLIIQLPPRAGKSELFSDFAPSWFLGHHPEWEIIAASYAQALPIGFSRKIRDRIQDPEYNAIFEKTRLRKDSQAIDAWKTTEGGGYMAAGVGVGTTGFGYHIGIVDDPVKDQEAAQSETIRANTLAWYQSVFRTRVAPGGGILIIMTRWHDADLAGAVLAHEEEQRQAGVAEEELENWKVVSFPALAESDEYLMRDGSVVQGKPADPGQVLRLLRRKDEAVHPERYTALDYRKLRNTLAPSIWSSLYQQNPAPDDGEFFKRSEFVYRQLDFERARAHGVIFTTTDYAFKEKKENDFTVIATCCLMPDNSIYVLDIRRGRWRAMETVRELLLVFHTYKVQIYGGEQGATHAAVMSVLKEEMMKPEHRQLTVTFNEELQPIQDKTVRARPLQALFQLRRMIFCINVNEKTTVWDVAERELLRFPKGSHDDIVDALAWAARLGMDTPTPRGGGEPPKLKSWLDELQEEIADQNASSFMAG